MGCLDGAEAVVGLDQRPWVRRSRAVAVLPRSRCDAVELLVEVREPADVLAVDGERELLDACGPAADAGGVGVAAGAKELELEVRGSSSFEAVDAEVGHHGLAVAVADGGDDLLVLGAGELVEEDAVGRTSLTMSIREFFPVRPSVCGLTGVKVAHCE